MLGAYIAIAGPGDTNIGISQFGESACADIDGSDLQLPSKDFSRLWALNDPGFSRIDADRASANPSTYDVCITDATAWQRVAMSTPDFAGLLATLGALLLVNRVIKTGRTKGLFTVATASSLRGVGLFLLAMAVVQPLVDVLAEVVVLRSADGDNPVLNAVLSPPVSMLLVLTALGVLAMARVLRLSVVLQDEVDATA